MIQENIENSQNLKISIIIPAYNAAKTIAFCLDSLLKLDFPTRDREIIVVDNNSTDNTKEIILRYPVKYVFEARKTRGAARNKGISVAKGQYIAFIDSDCVAKITWLKELVKGIENDKDVAACGGKITTYKTDTLLERYADNRDLLGQDWAIDPDITQRIPRVVTANAIFRRDTLEEVGLFDEDLITSEDTELGWRIALGGYRMKYIPEAIVYHGHINNLKNFCFHQFEFGLADRLVNLKYRSIFNLYTNESRYFYKEILLPCISTANFLRAILIKDRNERAYLLLDHLGKIFRVFGKLYLFLKRPELSDRLNEKRRSLNKKVYIKDNGYSWQLNKNIAWFLYGDSVRLFNFDDYSYYRFSEAGTQIWLKLANGRNLNEAMDEASKEYNVSEEVLKKDIYDFINQLSAEDILIKK